jgi:ubiquinone/menaquinone biosynthesis C-methylase UbiE
MGIYENLLMKGSAMDNLPYIHGFSSKEQQRLYEQADFSQEEIYRDVDLSRQHQVLEIGSGVGAQSEILLRRFPQLELTCIEVNEQQIAAAARHLAGGAGAEKRYRLLKMDAMTMSFAAGSFDGAFICWVLEHMKDHARLLRETRRVLQPGAPIYVSEVINSSFFLDPYSPAIWKYWMAFNEYQYDNYGDPFVGAKLGNLLLEAGFHGIRTRVHYWHFDRRYPEQRARALRLWKDLLLSAEERLRSQALVSEELVAQMKREFAAVEADPEAVFFDAFVQAEARA